MLAPVSRDLLTMWAKDGVPDDRLRRTPLARRTQLARGDKPLARTGRLNPVSKKKAAADRSAGPIKQAVRARDRACVLRQHQHLAGRCFGGPEVHHLLKANKCGEWSLTNCVLLCRFHNQWIENGDPALARRLGLVVTRGITAWECWQRMVAAGLPVTPPEPCCDLPDIECDHGGAA